MSMQMLKELEDWFEQYVASFASGEPDFQRQMNLKKEHTRRVCHEITYIATELELGEESLFPARVSALFHDIGRFAQYARYQTFVDSASVNHAILGTRILKKNGVLSDLEKSMRNLILKVIAFHNRASLPGNEAENILFFSRLLRDADKLDIWRILTDYYQKGADREKNSAIELSLPDTPGISRQVYQRLIQGRCIDFASMKNLNDFKLLQAGWVFDVNFLPTFKRLQDRNYLGILQKSLPETGQIRQIFNAIDRFIAKKLAAPSETARPAGTD